MCIPSGATYSEILGAARARHAALIDEFAGATTPGESTAAFCSRAKATVERYNAALLDELMRARPPASPADAARARDGYIDLTLDFARAVCNTAPERAVRHAVAQAVQCVLLECELQLRATLDAAMSSRR